MRVRCKHNLCINTTNFEFIVKIIINENETFEAVNLDDGRVELSKEGLYIKMLKIDFDEYFVPVR